ncbi:MAG: hypothetical protein ABEI31_10135 [Halodesulfurarchaeum sp.]
MYLAADLSATFRDVWASLEIDVDPHVADRETLSLLGPSGAGKTVVLEPSPGSFIRLSGVDHWSGGDR